MVESLSELLRAVQQITDNLNLNPLKQFSI